MVHGSLAACTVQATKAAEIHRKERSGCAGVGGGGFLEHHDLNENCTAGRKKSMNKGENELFPGL